MNLYSKIKRRFLIYSRSITTVFGKISLKLNGAKYGSELKIGGHIKIYNAGTIEIGNKVTINSAMWANPISAASQTCLQVAGGGYFEDWQWNRHLKFFYNLSEKN